MDIVDVLAVAQALANGKHVTTSANCTHWIVIPPEGGMRRVTREIMALAENPRDVQLISRPRTGLRITKQLHQKYSDWRQDISSETGVA